MLFGDRIHQDSGGGADFCHQLLRCLCERANPQRPHTGRRRLGGQPNRLYIIFAAAQP